VADLKWDLESINNWQQLVTNMTGSGALVVSNAVNTCKCCESMWKLIISVFLSFVSHFQIQVSRDRHCLPSLPQSSPFLHVLPSIICLFCRIEQRIFYIHQNTMIWANAIAISKAYTLCSDKLRTFFSLVSQSQNNQFKKKFSAIVAERIRSQNISTDYCGSLSILW